MTRLTVSVSGAERESRLLTIPVDIYAPDGAVLAKGIASPNQPATFNLPSRELHRGRVYVLGRLPSGETIQQTAELTGESLDVLLRLGEESPNEWLQWVTPFHSLDHLRPAQAERDSSARRIGKVWMTLWVLREGRWQAEEMHALDRQRERGMQQVVLNVSHAPHLLQVGGEEVAWRMIALPPGGAVRVAFTRSPTDSDDSLEIAIGRTEPDNELIMSYLASGAIADASRLADAWKAADLMLFEKRRDPISATAGAYLLLKSRRLQDRRQWVDNLVNWFPYMADGAIISAALALQREDAKEAEIRGMLKTAISRGLPIFSMGVTVLVETMAAIHRGRNESKSFHAAYLAAQAYARALCSRGTYFAFHGKSPAEPSWTPIYGLEDAPSSSPTSAPAAGRVIYARPLGAKQVGKFGGTRVKLPRAPVSDWVVKDLLNRADQEGFELPRLAFIKKTKLQPEDQELFNIANDLGIPVIETNFLQELLPGPASLPVLITKEEPAAARYEEIAEELQNEQGRSVPRQTLGYWRKERLKHATPLFGEEE